MLCLNLWLFGCKGLGTGDKCSLCIIIPITGYKYLCLGMNCVIINTSFGISDCQLLFICCLVCLLAFIYMLLSMLASFVQFCMIYQCSRVISDCNEDPKWITGFTSSYLLVELTGGSKFLNTRRVLSLCWNYLC